MSKNFKEKTRRRVGLKQPSRVASEISAELNDHLRKGSKSHPLFNIDPLTGDFIGFEFGKSNDPVKKPSHYQGRHGMEAVDVIKNFGACPEYEEGFYWGNAIKYMLRWHAKNGVEDLKKARQNLEWLIQSLERGHDE